MTNTVEDTQTFEDTKVEDTKGGEIEAPVVTLKEEQETLNKEETPKEEETPKTVETPKEEEGEEMSIVHQKARQPSYQGAPEDIVRHQIKDGEVDWKIDLTNYSPIISTDKHIISCLLYTSPSPRDQRGSRMPSSA